MKLFLSALIVAAAAGVAQAKEWRTGDVLFQSGAGAYVITNEAASTSCRIHSWPVDNPVATLSCDDGKLHTMELVPPNSVKVDGMLLSPVVD